MIKFIFATCQIWVISQCLIKKHLVEIDLEFYPSRTNRLDVIRFASLNAYSQSVDRRSGLHEILLQHYYKIFFQNNIICLTQSMSLLKNKNKTFIFSISCNLLCRDQIAFKVVILVIITTILCCHSNSKLGRVPVHLDFPLFIFHVILVIMVKDLNFSFFRQQDMCLSTLTNCNAIF